MRKYYQFLIIGLLLTLTIDDALGYTTPISNDTGRTLYRCDGAADCAAMRTAREKDPNAAANTPETGPATPPETGPATPPSNSNGVSNVTVTINAPDNTPTQYEVRTIDGKTTVITVNSNGDEVLVTGEQAQAAINASVAATESTANNADTSSNGAQTTSSVTSANVGTTGQGGSTAGSSVPTLVTVTEKVPGAGCVCKASCNPTDPIEKRKYECTITPGLAGFQQMLATIIKWFINIVMLCAVLAIVGLGIAWSFAGGDDAKAKTSLKKWGVNIMVGLIILFFFRYILQFLAPWIYK